MRFARYEKYRKPEIDFIDKIPSHWTEKKFRFIFFVDFLDCERFGMEKKQKRDNKKNSI